MENSGAAGMSATYCGIDFGTSNSTVSVVSGAAPRLIPLEGDSDTLPSAAFYFNDGGAPIFGRAAVAAYVEGEDGRLLRGLKSTLGSSLIDEKTVVGRRVVAFRDVLGHFFAHLKDRLQADQGAPVTRAVLGRPVHFVDGDPAGDAAAQDALEQIARAQGFEEIAFQFEPIAAALQYERTVRAEEIALIFDIGGGTSDFSIVRVSPERAAASDRSSDILASFGRRIGGTDFDRALSLAQAMPHLGMGSTINGGKLQAPRHYFVDLATWHRINTLYTQRIEAEIRALQREADDAPRIARLAHVIFERRGHSLAMAVEAAKIALSNAEAARLPLKEIAGGPNPAITRAAFEEAGAALIDGVRGGVATTLAQAGLRPDQIDSVFLTGGSSGMPVLQACVAALLPGARVESGDMLGSVGAGLALDARSRWGEGRA